MVQRDVVWTWFVLAVFSVCQVGKTDALISSGAQDPTLGLELLRFQDIDKDTQTLEEPIRESLLSGERSAFGLEVLSNGETYPDIVLTLEVDKDAGDTDIYCHTWSLARNAALPAPSFSVWRSEHSQGEDTIFISRRHQLYLQEEVVNVTVGGEELQGKRFVCSLYGSQSVAVESRLEIDVVYGMRTLVKEEQKAIKAIHDTCCFGVHSCPFGPGIRPTQFIGGVASEGDALDFCHIVGNVCDEDGRLTRLSMRAFNLACEFPVDAIKKFKRLRKLELEGNRLRGDVSVILEELASLKSLNWLNLNSNSLSGELSVGEGGICKHAQKQTTYIALSFNAITGSVPGCLFDKESKFQELHFDGNRLNGELPEFSPMSPLEVLTISGTNVTGMIPASIGELGKLRALRLSQNKLFGSIPNTLGTSEALEILDLNQNSLEGGIPASLATSPSLLNLQLAENDLENIPKVWEFGSVASSPIQYLDLSSNQIKSEFPLGLAKAPSLAHLSISHNKFGGNLPEDQDLFPQASALFFAYNDFTGSIPDAFGTIGMFSGRVPTSSAAILTLAHNNLTGDVPEFLFDSERPSHLATNVFLGGNEFTCPEPGNLHGIPDLICFVKSKECNDTGLKTSSVQEEDKKRKKDKSGLSTGATVVIGLVVTIASVLLLLVLGAIITVVVRKKNWSRQLSEIVDNDKDIEVGERRF